MYKILLPLVLVAGCSYLSPVGPSICPLDPDLLVVSQRAVDYWNDLGARLEPVCGPGALPLPVRRLPDNETGHETTYGLGQRPTLVVDPIVLRYITSGDPKVVSGATEVIAHELGHALGFAHVESDGWSVMFPQIHTMPAAGDVPVDGELVGGLMVGR